jgi:hypothetical protein
MRIDVYSDNSSQMEITNDKCERNNIVVLQATFPEIKVPCDLMTDSSKPQTANLQQKGFIKVDYSLKDTVTTLMLMFLVNERCQRSSIRHADAFDPSYIGTVISICN